MNCKGCGKSTHFYQETFDDNNADRYHIECYRKHVEEQKQVFTDNMKSQLRGYVGWQGQTIKDNTIRVNNTGDPNEDIRKPVQEAIKKQETKQYDELMAQVKGQLISVLNRNVQPELNILSEKLLEQAQDSRSKGLCLVCNKIQSAQNNCNNPICNDCMSKILLDN